MPKARRSACSAPARANPIGNPSDQYGGSTLGVSLLPRAWAARDASEPGRVDGAVEIAHAVLWRSVLAPGVQVEAADATLPPLGGPP